MAETIRVLYVDDEPDLLNIGKLFLEREGAFAVDTLTSAKVALEHLKTEHYDAIVSDYQMPEMDGIAFLKHLKASGDITPFIIFTGKGREEVVIEALNEGADFYLQKGGEAKSQFTELANKIRYAVSRRNAEQDLRESEERYRHVVEDQTEFICRFLPDGTHIFVNEAYCRYFGTTRDEITGTRFRPAIHPEDREQMARHLASLTMNHPLVTIDQRVIMPDGSIRWQRWVDRAIFHADGNLKEYQSVGRDVTEIKEAEEERLKSERRFRLLFDNAILGIFQTTPEGKYIDMNPAFARIYGYNSPEEMKSAIRDIQKQLYIHLEDRQTVNELLSTVGEIRNFETENRHRDGHSIWISINAKVVRDNNGEILAYEGTIDDITERKRAENALRGSETQYRSLVDSAPIGIGISDLGGTILDSNPAMLRITGYSLEEFKKVNVRNTYANPDDHQYLITSLQETGEITDYEVQLKQKDGTLYYALLNSRIIDINEQKLLLTTTVDITERKHLEEKLLQSEAKHRTLVETTPDILWEIDTKGNFVYLSPQIKEILGYSSEDLMGKSIFSLLPPESISESKASLFTHLQTSNRLHTLELPASHCDGRRIIIEIRSAALFDHTGKVTGFRGIAHDITERKRTEEEFRESAKRYNTIYGQSPIAIELYDAAGMLVNANPACLDLFGIENIQGIQNFSLFGDPNINDEQKKRLHQGETVQYQGPFDFKKVKAQKLYPTNRDGIIWLDVLITPLGNRADSITGFLVQILDITERKRAEEALHESEEKYRTIFENAGDAIAIHDLKGNFIEVNDIICRRFGYSRKELLTMTVVDVDDPVQAGNVEGRIQELIKKGHIVFETVHIARDGRRIPTEASAVLFHLGNKPLVMSIARDITERKRAEEPLQKNTEEDDASCEQLTASEEDPGADLDKMKRQGTALRDSKRELANIIEFLPDATLVIDRQGTVIAWNRAMVEMTGVPAEQMIGKGNYEYALPFYHERRPITVDLVLHHDPEIVAKYPVMQHEGRSLRSEIFIPHLNKGQGAHLWFTASPLYDTSGNIMGAIESIRDITDRWQAEETRRILNAYNRSLIEAGLDPLVTINSDGKIADVNTSTEKVTGYSRDELIGTDFSDYFTEPEKAREGYRKVFDDGVVRDYPLEIRHRNGTITSVLYNATIYRDEAGTVLGIFAAAHDITDRKRIEKTLRISEERLQLALNVSQVGTWDLDLVNHTAWRSLRHDQIFGYETLLPEWTYEMFLEHVLPEDRDRVDLAFKEAQSGQHDWEFECRIRRKDGEIRWIWARGRIQYDNKGGQKRMLGLVQDITGRKQAEEALRQANKKLNLLSSITRHDINNQLTVQMGYLSMLEKKRLDPKQTEYFQKISTAAKRISAMIQFTKEYEEIGVHAPAWQDCHTLVDTAAKQAPLGKVLVNNDLPAGMEVLADPLIIKVFYNLMDNAVRYGGKITKIRFFVEESGDDHLIVCEDDGDGIPQDEKEKIFERGYGKNTGLGLAISREILDITGISIRETGEPGKGARFEIVVPNGAWRIKGKGY